MTAATWSGACTRCHEQVTVHIMGWGGHDYDVTLDPARFVCALCRDPRQRQLELDGGAREETIRYPPDMVALPGGF